jgi:hypothetical protein
VQSPNSLSPRVAKGDLIRADDQRPVKAWRDGGRFRRRQAFSGLRGRFAGEGVFGNLRIRAVERQPEPRQQFAAVARGRSEDEAAGRKHDFVLTRLFRR